MRFTGKRETDASPAMFGSLFEEEEGFSLVPSGGRVVKREGEPPPPRGRVNLSGIKNQGGTCYLNSLLQTLLFTPEFRGERSSQVTWCSVFG